MDQGDGSSSSRKAGRRIAAASQGVAGRRRRRVRRIKETLDVTAGRQIRASLDVAGRFRRCRRLHSGFGVAGL